MLLLVLDLELVVAQKGNDMCISVLVCKRS